MAIEKNKNAIAAQGQQPGKAAIRQETALQPRRSATAQSQSAAPKPLSSIVLQLPFLPQRWEIISPLNSLVQKIASDETAYFGCASKLSELLGLYFQNNANDFSLLAAALKLCCEPKVLSNPRRLENCLQIAIHVQGALNSLAKQATSKALACNSDAQKKLLQQAYLLACGAYISSLRQYAMIGPVAAKFKILTSLQRFEPSLEMIVARPVVVARAK